MLRFGELFLKGKNRHLFEKALERDVRRAVAHRPELDVRREHGRIFVLGADDANLLAELGAVFGISSLSPIRFCAKELDEISSIAVEMAKAQLDGAKTFRISARRSDKRFRWTSADLGRLVGAEVARETGLNVDLEAFDLNVGIEIGPDWTFLWSTQRRGAGGLPAGTSGRAALLLSGGIDSPVAGHLMQKRGLHLSGIYFHAFPYTGDGVKAKVVELARILARRQGELLLHVVPFTALQECFRDNAPSKCLVVLYRRAMIRIAQQLAKRDDSPALITGESLGQVASQTVTNLSVIQEAAELPIFRPLIGFDKAETVALAESIGTYQTSILPHDDCCSLFVPKHPETKAHLPSIRSIEAKFEWQPLLQTAVEQTERIVVSSVKE